MDQHKDCHHETKESRRCKPTRNIADKGEQREGPTMVIVGTPELKLYTLSHRSGKNCDTQRQ
ncbi:BTB/POZ domain-containing protein [Pyrus ussuriensis x Pyrus communis]|uniref:BTB/POZ domain-containing protein n=1 Tax=Pyrus ussuriensis x Pyrus communis TaxID=2448454 RepID=A0A5N5I7H8_9ROSA|nr:BTB/POZ domain-containing protein [Pyrus ussuriensis x Pyrus communis]